MLVCLSLAGCVTHAVTRKELSEAMSQHSRETIYQVRYMGTKNDMHYIAIIHTLGTSHYRISKSEFSIASPFPLTNNRNEWTDIQPDRAFNTVLEHQSLYFQK